MNDASATTEIESGYSAPQAASPADYAATRFIGRQPIFDARQDIFGYELLFRSGWENYFQGESDAATRNLIDNFLLFGVDTLVRGGKAFINCTREVLVDRLVTFLPAQCTVLEVLETIAPDAEVIAACIDLKSRGYQIALDDFQIVEGIGPLIEIADYIKLDFRANGPAKLHQIRQQLRGSKAALIAEKIETQPEFERARLDGYQYFQGYFFCRPSILSSREIPANRMNYIRLLSALTRSPLNLKEVEQLVMAEASICYRLLRLVNSAAFGARREVTSIRNALVLTGEDEFRKLVSVVMAASLGEQKSPELVMLCLQRARFCELLATHTGQSAAEQYLIGLLSLVDAILRLPMSEVISCLPLRAEVRSALLGEASECAAALCLLKCYEAGDWESCALKAASLDITERDVTRLYLESAKWADHTSRFAAQQWSLVPSSPSS